MISLTDIVLIVVYVLIAIAVLSLLWWLIGYFEREWGGNPFGYKIARSVFIVLVVLALIFFLLSLVRGQPMFRI